MRHLPALVLTLLFMAASYSHARAETISAANTTTVYSVIRRTPRTGKRIRTAAATQTLRTT
jgi:hypothetical protein